MEDSLAAWRFPPFGITRPLLGRALRFVRRSIPSPAAGQGHRTRSPAPVAAVEVGCHRCGVGLPQGAFRLSLAYQARPAEAAGVAASAARFDLCRGCAREVVRWIAGE